MLVAFFNIIGEKLRTLGLPVSGIPASNEIVSYLHIPVVFLAAAYVTFDRGHTRIDMLTSKFPKALQELFITIGYLFGVAICTFVSWRAFIQMGKFITRHKMSSVTGVAFPLWPFALVTALGFGLLALSFLWSILRQYINKDHSSTSTIKGGVI
jgi:TRAP-type C4-dicarboxylate transport system permease small subunit